MLSSAIESQYNGAVFGAGEPQYSYREAVHSISALGHCRMSYCTEIERKKTPLGD